MRKIRVAHAETVSYIEHMSTNGDIEVRLSAAVKAEREERRWSLADLSARSGVSKAMISRIERGEAKPTAALLMKLTEAFGLTLSRFFARVEQKSNRFSQHQDQPEWRDPESGYTRRQVISIPDHPIEITQVELPPGISLAFSASSYALLRQSIWVQEGVLTVKEGSTVHRLAAGDCLAFGPPSDVELRNSEKIACRYTVVISRT